MEKKTLISLESYLYHRGNSTSTQSVILVSPVCIHTGELSESQKEALERSQSISKQQETELTELRQQMVKLSQIVDTQTTENKELNSDLR